MNYPRAFISPEIPKLYMHKHEEVTLIIEGEIDHGESKESYSIPIEILQLGDRVEIRCDQEIIIGENKAYIKLDKIK